MFFLENCFYRSSQKLEVRQRGYESNRGFPSLQTKIVSHRRERAKWGYDGAVFGSKTEIPVYIRPSAEALCPSQGG